MTSGRANGSCLGIAYCLEWAFCLWGKCLNLDFRIHFFHVDHFVWFWPSIWGQGRAPTLLSRQYVSIITCLEAKTIFILVIYLHQGEITRDEVSCPRAPGLHGGPQHLNLDHHPKVHESAAEKGWGLVWWFELRKRKVDLGFGAEEWQERVLHEAQPSWGSADPKSGGVVPCPSQPLSILRGLFASLFSFPVWSPACLGPCWRQWVEQGMLGMVVGRLLPQFSICPVLEEQVECLQ